jgi:predicted nucleic-acid-binding Zn-ribbon protein
MYSEKFLIIIQCRNCGNKYTLITGYAVSKYGDIDDDIMINIMCPQCEVEETVKL